MRRQFIWMQAALCAVAFSSAAPVLARANNGQPPPNAQAHGHDKNKDKDNKDKDKDNKGKAKPQAHAWDQRFHGLDRNRNNVVSRAEWNGDDRSFSSHDWNRDGVLSGDELIAGATRPTAAARPLPPPRRQPHQAGPSRRARAHRSPRPADRGSRRGRRRGRLRGGAGATSAGVR